MDRMVVCVWFPNWPLQRLRHERPALKSRPVVIHTAMDGRGAKVVTCSPWAARQGVRVGTPLAEAQALVELPPSGVTRPKGEPMPTEPTYFELHNAAADVVALQDAARTCEAFTPLFGIEDGAEPECLLLDVSGCGHLWHGEQNLVSAIAADFRRRGFQVRAALAPTIGAAWAASRYLAKGAVEPALKADQLMSTLSPLPVESLRLPLDIVTTLRELGLLSVGQLRALPRDSLPSRFGPLLLKRLDQAFGDEPEVFTLLQPSEPVAATWVGEFPLTDRESFRFVCRDLVEQLLGPLRPRHEGIRQLLCRLSGAVGQTQEFVVGFLAPTDFGKHILDMLSLQTERATLPEEIAAVRLVITATASLVAKQRDLFGHEMDTDCHREVVALIDRLSNRLGAKAVVRARLLPEAQPELAMAHEPWLAMSVGSARTGSSRTRPEEPGLATHANGASRPLRLLSPPQAIEVSIAGPEGAPLKFFWNRHEHRVIRNWGPERIETGWWRETPARRDYFRVECQTGHHFWLFRRLDERDWFVHGAFD